ncbi:MAG: PAS domain-containing protein, partial [Microcella sp.]|nr:PAS domain-containing protein [Microcella sp.]
SVDAATRQIRLTDDTLRMFGLSLDAPLTNDDAWSLHLPGDRERVQALLEHSLETGTPFDTESTMVTTHGDRLRVRTIGEVERGDDGAVLRAHGAVWDITEFAIERDRARDLDERLAASLLGISDGLVFLDSEWRVTFINPVAELLLGREGAELVGHELWAIYPNTIGTPFEQAFQRAQHTSERVIHREWVDLTSRWVDVTIYPVKTGVVAHLRDTTADERAQKRERETRRQLEQQAALLDIARDAIIVRGLDHRVQYWNRAAAELYEWPAAEAIGRSIADLIYADLDEFDAATEAVLREGYWAGELMQRSRTGRSIVADCRWQVVFDDEGAPRAVLCVNTDITGYRKDQEVRARSQRMESLGTLAGGIAHDLNNVLTPILMSAQLLARDESDPDRLELLSTLETSVKRGAEMVRQVLAFARGVEGRRDVVSLDTLLDDIVAFARDALPETIALEVSRPETLPLSTGDVTQFSQVLTNLLLNSRDAMAGGGRLQLSATREHYDHDVTSIGHVAAPGDYVVISVQDDGHGM